MKTSSKLSLPALAAITSLMAGCAAINPAGLMAARDLDPLGAAPGDIAVAVGVPRALQLRNGDATFRLSFTVDDGDLDDGGLGAPLEETVALELSPSAGSGITANASDEEVYLARIPAADAPAIAKLQGDIRALRAQGVEGSGALSVAIVGGCFVGAVPESIAVSTWLQTDPADGFVVLNKRQDLSQALGRETAALLKEQLRPCPSNI
ncbi:MAG: hypothetical protein AAFR53_08025 [Pseudomonadota bacterium]